MRRSGIVLLCFLLLGSLAHAEDDPITKLSQTTLSYFKPMSGTVLSVVSGKVTVTLSDKDGLKPGMRLKALREGEPFLHPVTREVIGKVEAAVGVFQTKEAGADSSSGVMITGEARPGDRVRLSDTRVRMLFCQDKGMDWYLADDLYRKLKSSGRIEMVDTALETGDEKTVLAEAAKLGVEVAVILTAREADKTTFFRERAYWVSDGSLFLDTEIKIGADISKELRFSERLFSPGSGDPVMTFDLSFRGRFVASADIDGDGRQELLISNGKDIRVYMPGTDLQPLWEIKGSATDDHLWIDTVDLNKNGKDEVVVTSMKNNEVVSSVYEFNGSGFTKLWETRHFLRRSGNGLIAQAYSANDGFSKDILNIVWNGEFRTGEKVRTPKGVNIYDFVFVEGPSKEKLVFAYDEKGYLNLYDDKGTRTWKSAAPTGGFISSFAKTSPAGYLDPEVWSVKDRLLQRQREIMVVTRIPLAEAVRTVGYKSSAIRNFWWNGFAMEEGAMIDGIKGALLDYAVAGDKVIVLSSPFMGLKFENILKGENPLGSMLYIYSIKGR
ncbi:MAG: VCBS repeat-containing protein [Nitrospirae bacterium]|nr:MAG: VCBS repeat-containing protein [Nitrospirota bacterium]